MTSKLPYRYCLVPKCTNTSVTSPNKLFFMVPRDPDLRRKWCLAMKRDEKKNLPLSTKTFLHCCEDHFNIEEDMENYWQYKIMGTLTRYYLKKGTIPHKFDCQKSNIPTVSERSAAAKRKRMELVKEAEESTGPSTGPSTSPLGQESGFSKDSEMKERGELLLSTTELIEGASVAVNIIKHKGVQVNIRPSYRSKATMTVSLKKTVLLSPFAIPSTSQGTSPFRETHLVEKVRKTLFQPSNQSSSESSLSEISEYKESEADSGSDSFCLEEEEEAAREEFKMHMLKGTVTAIQNEPKFFIGLPKKSFYINDVLSKRLKIPVFQIYLVLRKIRLNEPFNLLAINFGVSTTTASRIFSKVIPKMAPLMQQLLLWPSRKQIRLHLPIPFRARYNTVAAIIDCLEIEIERPSNAVHQALTWSEYYKCNTIKFLISCTPDGLVNFVSESFGGRASDETIFKECGILNKVEAGTAIMADRGFKNIAHSLETIGSKLIRPPSVSASEKSQASDVKLTKRVAALRIHVERVIGRLREFNMLLPHTCVDNHLVPIMDNVIIIACGLINLQDYLIKMQL